LALQIDELLLADLYQTLPRLVQVQDHSVRPICSCVVRDAWRRFALI
jgi:hypothetical protein